MKPCYRVIPTLIEQPTWGGTYIAHTKQLGDEPVLRGKTLGQSYELYEHSMVYASAHFVPAYLIGDPSSPQDAVLHGDVESIAIEDLLTENPENFLGKAAMKLGNGMQVLIKLTQAMGNSFQLHVKPAAHQDSWDIKPESWYYLAPGVATIGVRKGVDWDAYQAACVSIDAEAQRLSRACVEDAMRVSDARKELADTIAAHDIYSYVNQVVVQAGQTIDLSTGGVHHSWEEDAACPEGNIVYEVQKNAYDPSSTIRSFDKGKIKEDGSIRTLQIDDYFAYVDRSEVANNPETHMREPERLYSDEHHTVSSVFDSDYYRMEVLELTGEASSDYTNTTHDACFHHLYAHGQAFTLKHADSSFTVPAGWSVIVPAVTGSYTLTGSGSVFKTFV